MAGRFAFRHYPPDLSAKRHRIAGTVLVDGSPARRRVYAFDRLTLDFLGATWSNAATGAWEIWGMAERPEEGLLVVALDYSGTHNAEPADYVSQVATP